jgi:gliding motility-associated-like protein
LIIPKQISRIFGIIILLQGIFCLGAFDSFGQTDDFLRIDSVSVLPGEDGHVVIGWTLQTSENFDFIKINRQLEGGTYEVFYTIEDPSITHFIDNNANANLGSVSYYLVFSEDSPTLYSDSHSTIFLEEPQTDPCSNKITLNWLNYKVSSISQNNEPLDIPFDSIRFQDSNNGVTFEIIETFDQPPTSDELQEYSFEGLEPGQHFFRIQSFNSENGYTSTSNVRPFGYNPPQLEYFVIDFVDVVENQEIQVSFSGTGDTDDFYYEVDRSTEAGTGYETVAGMLPPEVFTDFPDIQSGPWFYRVKAWLKDWACELPGYETEGVFSSIFLEVGPGNKSRSFDFSWSHFYPADLQFLYRLMVMTEKGDWELVPGVVDTEMQSFVFDAPSDMAGKFVFKIEGYEQEQPLRTISSNYVTIEVEPVVFIPNALRPDSQNPDNTVFKPVFQGFTPEGYELYIFNRWGQQLFSSTSPELGWDGSYDGRTLSPGVYTYQVRYQVPGGKGYEKSGVVNLVY